MKKRDSSSKIPSIQPITIGAFTLSETGMHVTGHPSFGEYQGAGDFIRRAHKASGWWLADWIVYGDTRAEAEPEWKERLDAEMGIDQLTDQTVREYRYVANAIPASSRLDGVSFALHQACASLTPKQQQRLLTQARDEGWTLQEMRQAVRNEKRATITGQAALAGMHRVWLVDCPWTYNDDEPSAVPTTAHYPEMSVKALCAMGNMIQAHTLKQAVMFFWVTAPMLYYATDPAQGPDPYRVIRAWGFEPKTGAVWDKVAHNFGHYVSVRHEHLLIATRGSCTPDRQVPMIDSVFTERKSGVHSEKPECAYTMIERLYDGPYCEMFARKRRPNWTTYGNQILGDIVERVG